MIKYLIWIPLLGTIVGIRTNYKFNNGILMLFWFILQSISVMYFVYFLFISGVRL